MKTLTPEEREKLYAMARDGSRITDQFMGWMIYEARISHDVAQAVRRFMADQEKLKQEEPVST